MMDYDVEYSISEVAELTGYAPHVLRYYEKEFEIDVPRKDSNHRYYTYKEIELIQYIKALQQKGFSNKQIKLIIASPELVVGQQDETSLDLINNNSLSINTVDIANEITKAIEESFFERLGNYINSGNKDNQALIEELREEIISLRHEINSTERDVLICENAKLKMKVKEKTFEILELKQKIQNMEEENRGFLKRLFKPNTAR